MGARSRDVLLVLAVCALALGEPVNKTSRKEADKFYQYDDYVGDDQEEVLFSEDKPCPRDCICTVSQGYRIAKCNRLEVGTQKFGDDITDLVIENADPRFPIELDDFIFKKLGLHQVATVKIVNSTIGSIGPNAFTGLHELYAVNLSNNKLKNIHPETFANNRKLLLLTLANNPLKFPVKGSNDYFLNASSVQELDVSYCNIQHITTDTFKLMPSLMYLTVAGNSLSDVEPDTFKKLLDLEELDLSDNNIRSLWDDLFSDNTELATLHIQRNPIDTVYGLQISDLLTLNAGQTNIKFVGPSMFNGMVYIANLNLSGNGIEKIHNQAFHKLAELNYLDLSYNNLDFMSSILIKENIELDIFKISNNPKVKHLPENGFECAVEQFNIYLFDASNCGLEEIYDNSLSTFTALSQINLSGNKIKTVSPTVFSRSKKLVEINLANNLLTTLDAKIFEKNKELVKLYLQGNPLKVLPAKIFLSTPGLTWLDISHTQMKSLWNDEINETALSNLSYLNASHCHLTIIAQNDLKGLNKLKTLDINYNPLVCNSQFENLISLLNQRNILPTIHNEVSAKQEKDLKDNETTYSWDFLSKQVCGEAVTHIIEQLPSNAVSDEEIWERIDADSEGNMDLKDTLDDGKVASDGNKISEKFDNDLDENEDDEMDDDEGDDGDDEDEDDDASEDYADDEELDLSVKLGDKVKAMPKTQTSKPVEPTVETVKEAVNEEIKINVKLLDNDSWYDEAADPEREIIITEERGRYDYVWQLALMVVCALVLLALIGKIVMTICNRRSKQVRYNSAIVAAMSQAGRTKKDCGLIYQQLSEELTGPATPKLSRYQPLQAVTVNAANMSYESSPFHHNNIVPEAV